MNSVVEVLPLVPVTAMVRTPATSRRIRAYARARRVGSGVTRPAGTSVA